ncbi:hypothetical protein Hte_010258 [Hypoxylon texense]
MLSAEEMPWIADHRIGDTVLFPAAGTMIMALKAVAEVARTDKITSGYFIKEATFISPIVMQPEAKTDISIHLTPLQQAHEKTSRRSQVKIFTCLDDFWVQYFEAIIYVEYDDNPNNVDQHYETHLITYNAADSNNKESRCIKRISTSGFYKWLLEHGYQYGETFSLAEDISWDGHKLGTASIRL